MMTVSLYNCGHCKLPQLVGQQCHCRTPEDEAWEEMERRQGGGFQAKRQMAADKFCDANCVWTDHHPDCNMAADKLQEPVQPQQDESDLLTIAYQSGFYDGKKAALAQPAQEPVAWVWKDMRGQDIVSLFEPRFNSVPLYTAPPKRDWVGLTDEEIHGTAGYNETHETYQFALALITKLKERNS